MDGARQPKATPGPILNQELGAAYQYRCTNRSRCSCELCDESVRITEGFYCAGPSFSTSFICGECFGAFPGNLELEDRYTTATHAVCDLCGESPTEESPEMHTLNDFDVCVGCFETDLKTRFVKVRAPAEFIAPEEDRLVRAFPQIPVKSLPSWANKSVFMSTQWLKKQYHRIHTLPSPQWNAMACVVIKSSCEVLQRYTGAGLICLVACLSIPGCPVALMHRLRPLSMECWLVGPQLFDTVDAYLAHFKTWLENRSIKEWTALATEAETEASVTAIPASNSDYNKVAAKAETDYVTHLYLSVQGRVPDGLRH